MFTTTHLAAVGLSLAVVLVGACGGSSTPMAAKAATSTAAPTPLPTDSPTPTTAATPTPSPSPTVTATPAAAPTTATAQCSPGGDDLLVRYITPGSDPEAQELGGTDLVNCRPTLVTLQQTSPTGAGYCTQVALSKDNPGYDTNATPAPPLKHVIAAYGGGC